MEKLPFSTKLKMLKQQMERLEKKYHFEFPSSFSFDGFEKHYNNAKNKGDVNVINQMDFELFSYALQICDFTDMPQIIPDSEYENLSLNLNPVFGFDELYRGTQKIRNQANILFDEKYHGEIGGFCNGLYTTPSRIIAFSYTRTDDFSENNPLIMKLKVPHASVASEYELLALIDNVEQKLFKTDENTPEEIAHITEFVNSMSDEDRKKFVCALKMDISILAAILGYDCVYDRQFPSIVLLNREKLVVSQSQADKIKEAYANENASQPND